LLEKAFYHAEEVFVAMRLRGGENRLPLLYPLEFKYSDFALTGCVFIVVLIPHVVF
jgi:energy-coupling factor transporter transmembrane protein EcfT